MSVYKSEMIMIVPFYDNDPMGIIWHGNYLKYLEQARCDMFDKIGYNYLNMRDDGISYPVAKFDMKFIKPATFNQKLRIVTAIEELEPALIIKYIIFDDFSGDKIFTANSMQICVNINDRRTLYIAPKKLKDLLNV